MMTQQFEWIVCCDPTSWRQNVLWPNTLSSGPSLWLFMTGPLYLTIVEENFKNWHSKGPVINNRSDGPEVKVLGHNTFCLQFVGSQHTIHSNCWVITHFLMMFKCPPTHHSGYLWPVPNLGHFFDYNLLKASVYRVKICQSSFSASIEPVIRVLPIYKPTWNQHMEFYFQH